MAVSAVQSGQSGVYTGIAGSHRVLMLRRHGREGLPPMSSIIPGQDAHARQEPRSEHLCGVFVRRHRGAECRKTCGKGVKWTKILGMSWLRVFRALW